MKVTAMQRIYDTQPDGREVCIARPGDRGTVEHIDTEGVLTVRWERSGRAIDCDDNMISEAGHGF